MKKYDAFISGYICIDLIPDFNNNLHSVGLADMMQPGKLTEINGMGFYPGGVVSNTGLAMKKFGHAVYLNGLSGDDFIGRLIREWLNKYSIPNGINTTNEMGSAFGLVIAPPGTDRIFLESPGCSKIFDLHHIDFEIISQSRLFHFGYPPLLRKFYQEKGKKLLNLFSGVQDLGVITSLDFSLPDPESDSGKVCWTEILDELFPFTDIFVPSLEEALYILEPETYREIDVEAAGGDILNFIPVPIIRRLAKRIVEAGVKIVMIKAGHHGAYLMTGDVSALNSKHMELSAESWNNIELWCPAYPTQESKIKNSSGAGDVAVAGFLSSILKGDQPATALKFATIAGRNNLYCDDIYEEMSNWEELTKELFHEPGRITDLSNGILSKTIK